LGSVELTHPFHPFRGQKFIVLKLRTVSGLSRLSLRHSELGTFAVPADWTDWPVGNTPPGSQALMIDAFGLAELAVIVESLIRDSKRA